jgi:hypothetical protein
MRIRREKIKCQKCGTNANEGNVGIQYINAACELSGTVGKVNKRDVDTDTGWGQQCVLGVGARW